MSTPVTAHDPYSMAGNTRSNVDNRYLTSCSICRLGVDAGQRTVWTRGQYLGTSHEECARELCPRCNARMKRPLDLACTTCAVTRERFGDPQDLIAERFGTQERTTA